MSAEEQVPRTEAPGVPAAVPEPTRVEAAAWTIHTSRLAARDGWLPASMMPLVTVCTDPAHFGGRPPAYDPDRPTYAVRGGVALQCMADSVPLAREWAAQMRAVGVRCGRRWSAVHLGAGPERDIEARDEFPTGATGDVSMLRRTDGTVFTLRYAEASRELGVIDLRDDKTRAICVEQATAAAQGFDGLFLDNLAFGQGVYEGCKYGDEPFVRAGLLCFIHELRAALPRETFLVANVAGRPERWWSELPRRVDVCFEYPLHPGLSPDVACAEIETIVREARRGRRIYLLRRLGALERDASVLAMLATLASGVRIDPGRAERRAWAMQIEYFLRAIVGRMTFILRRGHGIEVRCERGWWSYDPATDEATCVLDGSTPPPVTQPAKEGA